MPKVATDKITARKLEVLKCIYDYNLKTSVAPTIRDIMRAINLSSTSTAHGHVKWLKERGYLTNEENKNRTLALTEKALIALEVQ